MRDLGGGVSLSSSVSPVPFAVRAFRDRGVGLELSLCLLPGKAV